MDITLLEYEFSTRELKSAWEWFEEASSSTIEEWIERTKSDVETADGCRIPFDVPMCPHEYWNPLVILGFDEGEYHV